jgi:hypothetical protein
MIIEINGKEIEWVYAPDDNVQIVRLDTETIRESKELIKEMLRYVSDDTISVWGLFKAHKPDRKKMFSMLSFFVEQFTGPYYDDFAILVNAKVAHLKSTYKEPPK